MSTPYTLYLNPITVNGIKTRLACQAMNLDPEIKIIELQKGEQKSAEFLALNPEGKIPVLVVADTVITESNAILQYLAHSHESSLWPREATAQAEILKWLFWQSGPWNIGVGIFSHRRVVLPHWGFPSDEPLSEKRLDDFHRIMSQFDGALAGKSFLVGDDFTIADISLGSYLIFSDEADIPLADYHNVCRWLEGLRATSWWQETYRQILVDLSIYMHIHEARHDNP